MRRAPSDGSGIVTRIEGRDRIETMRLEVDAILAGDESRVRKAERAASVIRGAGDFRWVGIYEVGKDEIGVIGWSGPGAPAYPRFPVTQGLSGAAVSTGESVVSNDVSSDPRYLTAFESTGSEMIVPIREAETGRVLGTVDVESERVGAFDARTRDLVEGVAGSLAPLVAAPTPPAPSAPARRRWDARRVLLAAIGLAVIGATFFFLLPKIADYRDVWGVVKGVSWPWIVALGVATVLNVLTFAPPWMVALPGLRFWPALVMTQASTALSIVFPGGVAVGLAGAYGMLRGWGFPRPAIGRALTLTSLWNQFANLAYPIVAVFLLTVSGGKSPLLVTAAFIGVAVLGVAVAALALVLASDGLATDIGDLAARLASWARGQVRRGPVGWGGASFERFRLDAVDLLARRWHLLTLTSLVGSLTVFLVLVVSLRALDVPADEVSIVEAFAAWALVRLIGSIPITPGGVGVIELGLTTALIGFGGNNAGVVAAVLVYRFLTIVPTLALGLLSAATWRRQHGAALRQAGGGGQ